MSFGKSVLSVAALSAAFAAGVVASRITDRDTGLEAHMDSQAVASAAPQTRPTITSRPGASGPMELTDVAEVAIRASVNISSTQQVRIDPWAQLFYGQGAVQSQTSLGSGVLVSADGYVVTNSHVVGSSDAQVHLTVDNRELPAQIVGIDPYTDLAVLKIDGRGLSPLPWGDSSKLRVAETVLAVGNPFAFNQTVTQGIISAVNRHDPQLATYTDFIQTDAAINRGNSGGALVNVRGELIGINTMIYSETGGYQGIGFAVPSNLARRIMTELIKNNGTIVRGWIGNLSLRTVSAEQASQAGFGNTGGVFVYTMYRTDPAFRAGLQPRDIIIRFNKTAITEQSQLQRLIADTPIGTTADVEIVREGKRQTIQIPIVRAPQGPPVRR